MKVRWNGVVTVMMAWSVVGSLSWAASTYPEPTEAEMQRAIERAMVDRGGTQTRSGEISVDNPLNGAGFRFTEFTKLGCEAAVQGPGYICSYHYLGKMTMHSNDGTQRGDQHAAAVNQLLKLFQGGRDEVGGSATRRFLKSGNGWTVTVQ